MAYGYYDDRPRYTSLMDMIDGGGAGRSGDRFEGGGLLSLLANELFRPAGYEDRLRQRKNDTGRAVTTVVDELMRDRAAMKEMDRQRGLQQDRFDTRDQQGASSFRAPVQPGPPMPATAMSPVMPNQPMSAYDEVPVIRGTAGTPTAPYEQTGAITDIRFGPRGSLTDRLDISQAMPSEAEQRVLETIQDANLMDQFINMRPDQQREYINRLIEMGY